MASEFDQIDLGQTTNEISKTGRSRRRQQIALECVLYFLKNDRKEPPSLACLPEQRKKNKMSTLRQYARKFTYDASTDTLYYVTKASRKMPGLPQNGVKVLFTRQEIENVLADVHGQGGGTRRGHLGEKRTQSNIAERFYWRNMTQDIKDWISMCPECQRTSSLKTTEPEVMSIYARQPWEVVGVDLVGPFLSTYLGHRYVVTATCLFSKWVEAEPVLDKSPDSLVQAISKWIYRWGPPLRIISDRKEFNNQELNKRLFKIFGIRHLLACTGTYNVETDGQEENTNESMKCQLSKIVSEKQRLWHLDVEKVCWGQRSAINKSTHFSPFEVMTLRKPHLPSDVPHIEGAVAVVRDEPLPNIVAEYVGQQQQAIDAIQ